MAADPELLKSVPFFQTLDHEERTAVAALMHEERIPAGTTIFRENDPGGVPPPVRAPPPAWVGFGVGSPRPKPAERASTRPSGAGPLESRSRSPDSQYA